MKLDDPAVSLSVLHATAGWLPSFQAAECAVALALATPLVVPSMAPAVLAPLTALLRTAHDRARPVNEDNSLGATACAVTLVAAKSSLLREVRNITAQLEQLRVPRGNVQRGASRPSTFEEQFAFGQALAQAREAAREAWRLLDREGEAAMPAALGRGNLTNEQQVTMPLGVRPPPSHTSGRRAW